MESKKQYTWTYLPNGKTHKHRTQLMATKGEGASMGLTDIHYHIYILDKQQGFTIWHKKTHSASHNNL